MRVLMCVGLGHGVNRLVSLYYILSIVPCMYYYFVLFVALSSVTCITRVTCIYQCGSFIGFYLY